MANGKIEQVYNKLHVVKRQRCNTISFLSSGGVLAKVCAGIPHHTTTAQRPRWHVSTAALGQILKEDV